MDNRLKSALATVVIQGALAYALIMGLAMSFSQPGRDKLDVIEIRQDRPPPPPRILPPPAQTPPVQAPALVGAGRPVILHDWAKASPAQRNLDFAKAYQWVKDNMPEGERRLASWRDELPQGTGPARVTRLRPPTLPTHTLYWPARWSKAPLPIVAWGNGHDGKCSNSSLPYAAFLSDIASHGYFVVAVGNDDIDYPQPEGLEILADGRPLRTQASALTKAVDWAIRENGRAGGPYAGKLDTTKVAYMGHGCGGDQALVASADPRTTTTVVLNSSAKPGSSSVPAGSLGHFEGWQDDGAMLAVPGARRWSKAVIAWLDRHLRTGAGPAPVGGAGRPPASLAPTSAPD